MLPDPWDSLELPSPRGECLRHEDVEPIALYPVKESNGKIVYQQLEEATQMTGVPREIISDRGSDLVAGMKMFREEHPYAETSRDSVRSVMNKEPRVSSRKALEMFSTQWMTSARTE